MGKDSGNRLKRDGTWKIWWLWSTKEGWYFRQKSQQEQRYQYSQFIHRSINITLLRGKNKSSCKCARQSLTLCHQSTLKWQRKIYLLEDCGHRLKWSPTKSTFLRIIYFILKIYKCSICLHNIILYIFTEETP